MGEHDESRFGRKEPARRSALDRDAGRGHGPSRIDRGPTIGKRSLTEGIAAEAATFDAAAFFDRVVRAARVQLAALARAISMKDRLLAVTAAGSLEGASPRHVLTS